MVYFFFNDQTKYKSFSRLLEFINDLDTDVPVTIFLQSDGGECEVARMLLHVLNQQPDRFTLIAGSISSSAFYLFYHARCKRMMLRHCIGMFHYGYQDVEMNDQARPASPAAKALLNNALSYELEGKEMSEKFMNETERRCFERGEEVFFIFTRMKEIFPDIEVI